MPPIATIDVSLPPAAGTLRRVGHIVSDLVLAVVAVLVLPLVLVIGAPLVVLAFIGVALTQRLRKSRPFWA